jgi:hypothetical protein
MHIHGVDLQPALQALDRLGAGFHRIRSQQPAIEMAWLRVSTLAANSNARSITSSSTRTKNTLTPQIKTETAQQEAVSVFCH